MNKTLVVIVAIIAIATVATVYFWCSHHRYYLVNNDPDPYSAFQIDRKTGDVWYIDGPARTKQRVVDAGTKKLGGGQ